MTDKTEMMEVAVGMAGTIERVQVICT